MNRAELSEVIDNAIVNEEVVRFWYLSPSEPLSPPQWRTFSPYEASDDGETILGYDHDRAAVRRFGLGNMLDIETTDEEYVRAIDQ